MNDIEFMLFEENRQKGIIARAAHNKYRPDRRPNINNISEARWRKMNGEVSNYQLSKPVDWKTFKTWPTNIQTEYINVLISKYEIGPIALAEMFGMNGFTVGRHLKQKLGITPIGKASQMKRVAFINEFVNGQTADAGKTPLEQEPEQPIPMPLIQAEIETPKEPKAEPAPQIPAPLIQAESITPPTSGERLTLTNVTVAFSGPFDSAIIADKLKGLIESGQRVKINIEIEALD